MTLRDFLNSSSGQNFLGAESTQPSQAGREPQETTPEHPRYFSVAHEFPNYATPLYFVCCDEGWCQSIVCERMYKWAADWLVETLQGKPFAPEHRP